jgi:opacity protein-like surface antigen
MNTKSNLLVTTAVATVIYALASDARASDLSLFKPAPAGAAYGPWYVQIEGGVAVFDPSDPNGGYVYGNTNGAGGAPTGYSEEFFGQAGPLVGFRIGYQFSPMFRGDFSLQYTTFTLTGVIENTSGAAGSCITTNIGACSLNGTRTASALVEMFNGYVDLDPVLGRRFGRYHPYFTAGVGVTQNGLGANCVSCDYGARNGSATTQQFAWALGVGMRVDMFSDMRLDIAYRYLNLGTFQGGFNHPVRVSNLTGGDSVHIDAHTVTAGLTVPFSNPWPF